MIPERLVRPMVGRIPTRSLCDEGSPDGITCVRAQAGLAEAGGDGSCGSAARACGNAREIVRVAGDAGDGTGGLVGAECPLGHVGLGEEDGAGGAQLGDHGGVVLGDEAFHRERSASGLQARGVVVVLNEYCDSTQGWQLMRGGEAAVAGFGFGERVWVDEDYGVEAQHDRGRAASCHTLRCAPDNS